MPKARAISRDGAESLAVQALAFLAQEPERLGQFLAASGIGPEMIRSAAADPGFLTGVLDFVAADEPLLLAFAQHAGIDPRTVERAQALLGGHVPQ
jgi:Protein of unknown function (DUF3572)